jgi:hypothetical protein
MLTEQLALVPGFSSYFAFSKARGTVFGETTHTNFCRIKTEVATNTEIWFFAAVERNGNLPS